MAGVFHACPPERNVTLPAYRNTVKVDSAEGWLTIVKPSIACCHPEPRRRVNYVPCSIAAMIFLASHSFTAGNAIQHNALFTIVLIHSSFQSFSGATPTEPDGHVDCLLDMPVACPYKQVAALQPDWWIKKHGLSKNGHAMACPYITWPK